MVTRVVVKKATYRDSISLMKVSNALSALPGVAQAAVVMATELNRRALSEAGFEDAAIGHAATDDMILAVEAKDQKSLDAAMTETEKLLSPGEATASDGGPPRSLGEALDVLPGANMAVISVPGQFAKKEAAAALARGLNVFLFSSNVSRADELELKIAAEKKGLLLMGPDCGTSIINHKVLGFGNVVREGAIGLVSASGTGLQEVATLIHKAGLGISQAIGTGGGDLSQQVGGITMIRGIRLLEADEETKVIVLVSKPPSAGVMEKVLEVARGCQKPVVVNFLGAAIDPSLLGNLRSVDGLDEAANVACEQAGEKPHPRTLAIRARTVAIALSEHRKLASTQRYVRGLFAGGTFCYESQRILRPLLGRVYSNSPVRTEDNLAGDALSKRHTCIDMGAEEFVEGRAHPMMDFRLRNFRIMQEARDPETAVILIDVELGYGSHADPASQLVPVVTDARRIAEEAGRHLAFVASIVGTEGDFQGLSRQEKALSRARVLVMPSNAQATKISALIAAGEAVRESVIGRSA